MPYRTQQREFSPNGPRGPQDRRPNWQQQQPPFLPQQQQQFAPPLAPPPPDLNDTFEVHDNHFKAPISLHISDLLQNAGSYRLVMQASHGQANRNFSRICEMFQHGQCQLGDDCPDIHVIPEVLMTIRENMTSWLRTRELEFSDSMIRDPNTTFRVFCADLKEVVEVPISALSFTRGLYVDPSSRAKRSRVGQPSGFAQIASQVPTACGLYSVDPVQCKWGCWCNQAHINPEWLAMKRAEFGEWSKSLEQRFYELPPTHNFYVHDPQTKTSMQIAKMAIAEFSRGLFQGSVKKAPSICMLYQRGRCTAHACCNQIHVYPDFLAQQRQCIIDGGLPMSRPLPPPGYSAFEEDQRIRGQSPPPPPPPPPGGPLGFNPNAAPFVPGPPQQEHAAATYYTQESSVVRALAPPPLSQLAVTQHQPYTPGTPTNGPSQQPTLLPSPLRSLMEGPRPSNHVSALSDLRTDDDEVYSGAPLGQKAQLTPVKQNNPYSSAGFFKPIGVPPSPMMASASTPTMPPSTPPSGTPTMQFSFVQPYRSIPAVQPLPSPVHQGRIRQTTPSSPSFPASVDVSNMMFSPSPLMKAAALNDSLSAMPKEMSLDDPLCGSLTGAPPKAT